MNLALRAALIFAVVLYFILIFLLLKKKRLSLKYTLLWIFSGIVMLVIVIFPEAFIYLVHSIGIIDYTNGLYSIALFLILIILMSITAIVSKLNEKNKKLIQYCALLEKRIRDLEAQQKQEQIYK